MDNNDNTRSKPRSKKQASGKKARLPQTTAFESKLMPGFVEALRKRASQSVTYQQIKNEYGADMKHAFDAGIGIDEFFEMYNDHKMQLSGKPMSDQQEKLFKSVYKRLHAEWVHGNLKSRKRKVSNRSNEITIASKGSEVVRNAKDLSVRAIFQANSRSASMPSNFGMQTTDNQNQSTPSSHSMPPGQPTQPAPPRQAIGQQYLDNEMLQLNHLGPRTNETQ
jgi:hypothetical protein